MKRKRTYGGDLCTPRAIAVPDAEWEIIGRMAKKAGMTKSAYVRQCFLSGIRPIPECIRSGVEALARDMGVTATTVIDRIVLNWFARALAWESVHGTLDVDTMPEFDVADDCPDDLYFQALVRRFSAELREAKLQEDEAMAKSIKKRKSA